MADQIASIVASRGKMHNPRTDSGGVALGTVTAVGDGFVDGPPALGDRVVTLASLTLTPLRLDRVVQVRPGFGADRGRGVRLRLPAGALGADARRPAARGHGPRPLRCLRRRLRTPEPTRRATARSACSAPATPASSHSRRPATRWSRRHAGRRRRRLGRARPA